MRLAETHIAIKQKKPIRFQEYAVGIFKTVSSKSGVKKAIKKKLVFIDGNIATTSKYILGGEKIELFTTENSKNFKRLNLHLEVLFEDDFLAIIYKPSGILVSGNKFVTIANGLSQNLKKSHQPDAIQPQPIHRLDYPTSGILLVGKTSSSIKNLSTLFEQRKITKTYFAITIGKMCSGGLINLKIDHKNASTRFKVLKSVLSKRFQYLNLVELKPDTGRKHQLRKHLSSIGHQILGDKVYGKYSYSDFDVLQDNINFDEGLRIGLNNRNLYFNASYKNKFGNNWKYETALSYTNDNTNIKIIDDKISSNDNSYHFKAKLKKRFSSRAKLIFGAEYFITNFDEGYTPVNGSRFNYSFDNNIFASFVETDIFFSKKLAAKVGVRAENSELLNQFTISPRSSISYKSGKNAQFSLAYGQFYQNPNNEFLKFTQDLKAQNNSHLIANFQSVKQGQIFRLEAYYKDYNSLVKFDNNKTNFNDNQPNFNSLFNNNGSGFAKGFDVFWRQNGKIKNTDYWISYSYLETERDYRNFPTTARPSFATKHNLSIVTKHWIEDWKSQIGFSYQFASGRNYTNPNEPGFLNNKTKNFNNLSFNWAYLIDQQKILYFSVNNMLGTKNVFGYDYKNNPNANGIFERQARIPNQDSFFFIGFFWTISDDKKSNQLDNL